MRSFLGSCRSPRVFGFDHERSVKITRPRQDVQAGSLSYFDDLYHTARRAHAAEAIEPRSHCLMVSMAVVALGCWQAGDTALIASFTTSMNQFIAWS